MLIDADILIDAIRGESVALQWLTTQTDGRLFISRITQLEVIAGARNKVEFQRIARALKPLPIVEFSATIGAMPFELFRQYRLSHGLQIPDALLAATALVENLPLATKNQRDFRFIAGLTLAAYP